MQADKKKIIVIAALVLVIVCVGVFQFVIGSGSPAPAPVVKKEEAKKPDAAAEEPVEEAKNPLFAAALPPRDPFQSALEEEKPAQPTPSEPVSSPQPKAEPRQPKLPPVEINTSGRFEDGGTAPVLINKVPEEQFAFSLSGVMLGSRPIAVFTDSQGNQRMIPVGGSLDAESKVLEVQKNAVTVRFHGKTLRLTVEGNPNDK